MATSPRVLVALLALALLMSACATTVTVSVPEGPTPEPGDASEPGGDSDDDGAQGAPGDDGRQSAEGAPVDRAVWTDASCDFIEPPAVSSRCGYLEVPERWDDPGDGDTLRLHVGIFSTGPKDTAPIVYLEGGPGGDPLTNIAQSFDTFFGVLAAEHDIVVLGQRGTGLSEPHLQCEEVLELSLELLDETVDDAGELDAIGDAYAECASGFEGQGIDTSAYNSIQNASDVDALREALGFEQWNVLGVSYGTRLGQTLLRLHPEGVRAIVLDSVLPTERDPSVDQPVTAQRAFEQLWSGCATSSVCSGAFPDVEDRFFALVDQLDADPIELEVANIITSERYDARIDGDDLMELAFSALYSRAALAGLPELVAQLEVGDTSGLASLASQAITSEEFIASGMFWSVECNEEVPFISEDALAAGLTGDRRYDRLRPQEALDLIDTICSVLDPGVAPPIEDEPVVSDVPALVLAGSYDPITPAREQQVGARRLRRRDVRGAPPHRPRGHRRRVWSGDRGLVPGRPVGHAGHRLCRRHHGAAVGPGPVRRCHVRAVLGRRRILQRVGGQAGGVGGSR